VPSASPELDLRLVEHIVERSCFGSSDTCRVGVELEWLALPTSGDGGTGASLERLPCARTGSLPGGSKVSFEPGGQLELSTPPCESAASACEALSLDVESVRAEASPLGIELVGLGMDPTRDPARIVDSPRYRAMEEYFALDGPAGKTMMCSTAAVQVNLDTGSTGSVGGRWRLAHLVGPTLAASFANSPFISGRPSGFKSTRLANWWLIDCSRTAPAARGHSHVGDWTRYTLDARVMMIRRDEREFVALRSPISFAEWMASGHELGHPTESDLEYHMTTLFPPVRPRGHFEIRYIDSLPEPWWKVPVAVASCLLDHPDARAAAGEAAAPTGGMWQEAATWGLEHPALAASATACFDAAESALGTHGDPMAELVAAYNERYVARGRCPADDRLEEWRGSGRLTPAPDAEPSWS
jgi:glutamate--cysteine ligase